MHDKSMELVVVLHEIGATKAEVSYNSKPKLWVSYSFPSRAGEKENVRIYQNDVDMVYTL